MNVLGLFDGMSCGQIALKELGIKIDKYYASEIDKHAIKQTQLNFPDTIQLGDINNWKEWGIDWASIDLVLAGSPCQGFSFAGKQLAFDDPRSKLFFVFKDIYEHIKSLNPNVKFLLENVRMKKEYLDVITEQMSVSPVLIDSALVSAQRRKRYYWTNICEITQPEDRGVLLDSILEDEVDEKYILSDKMAALVSSPMRLKKKYTSINGEKALTLMRCNSNNGNGTHVIVQRARGNNQGGLFAEKTPTLTSCSWEHNNILAGTWRTHKEGRGFRVKKDDKHPSICARAREDGSGQNCVAIDHRIRRLTPKECSRLQTIPEYYKWECSDSQAYKMLGNGWTVEVIKHILKNLIKEQ